MGVRYKSRLGGKESLAWLVSKAKDAPSTWIRMNKTVTRPNELCAHFSFACRSCWQLPQAEIAFRVLRSGKLSPNILLTYGRLRRAWRSIRLNTKMFETGPQFYIVAWFWEEICTLPSLQGRSQMVQVLFMSVGISRPLPVLVPTTGPLSLGRRSISATYCPLRRSANEAHWLCENCPKSMVRKCRYKIAIRAASRSSSGKPPYSIMTSQRADVQCLMCCISSL